MTTMSNIAREKKKREATIKTISADATVTTNVEFENSHGAALFDAVHVPVSANIRVYLNVNVIGNVNQVNCTAGRQRQCQCEHCHCQMTVSFGKAMSA